RHHGHAGDPPERARPTRPARIRSRGGGPPPRPRDARDRARSPLGVLDPSRVDPGPPRVSEAVLSLVDVRGAYDGAEILGIERLPAMRGEVLAVIGPNGSGKSTLLRLMGCLERPTAGEVRWRGRKLEAGDTLDVRRRIAMVFQQPLLAAMTVADNV